MTKRLKDSWIVMLNCNIKNKKELDNLPKKVDSVAKKIQKNAEAAGEEIEVVKFRLLGSMCVACSKAFAKAIGQMPEVKSVAPNEEVKVSLIAVPSDPGLFMVFPKDEKKKPPRPRPCLIGKNNALSKEAKKPKRPRICLIGKNAPGKKKK